MRRSNPKFSFDPGFSVTMKILSLVVLVCFLVFFGLVYAGEEIDPDNPLGEHPWDELNSGADNQPPKPYKMGEVIIFPFGDFGGWVIIHFPQVREGDKDRVQNHSSGKNQGKFFILF